MKIKAHEDSDGQIRGRGEDGSHVLWSWIAGGWFYEDGRGYVEATVVVPGFNDSPGVKIVEAYCSS